MVVGETGKMTSGVAKTGSPSLVVVSPLPDTNAGFGYVRRATVHVRMHWPDAAHITQDKTGHRPGRKQHRRRGASDASHMRSRTAAARRQPDTSRRPHMGVGGVPSSLQPGGLDGWTSRALHCLPAFWSFEGACYYASLGNSSAGNEASREVSLGLLLLQDLWKTPSIC